MRVPSFTLNVLGGFRLYRSGVPVELPNRKLAFLLTYLACTAPAPQSRERLANLFWEAHSDERARHNLRQALSRLRRVLGSDAIVNVGEAVRLASGVVACDAVKFEELLKQDAAASMAEAADIYDGALLDGVAVGATAWNEWLLPERQRLKERAIGAIVTQGERWLASGGAESAIRCGRRAIAFDNFREDAHRLVLKGLSAAGRTSEALRHYQDLVVFLESELNADPDEETRLLALALGRLRAPGGTTPAQSVAPQRRGPLPLAGAERRHVTLLVCNAATSPSRTAAPDPEDLWDPLSPFRRTAADIVASFGGSVLSSLGNSLQACFGYPNAHEHDAVQAVLAGVALIHAAQGQGAAPGQAWHASVGVASGLVIVEEDLQSESKREPVVIGEAPMMALQLQTLAAPGEIIVSRETRLLLGSAFELRPIDATHPRGGTERLEAWLVTSERGEGGRLGLKRETPPPLVGRQEEFDLLLRRWDQVKRGQGSVVLLSGEPGIGKSCIVEHLLLALEDDEPTHLQYFGSPHQAVRPLHPYIEQVERSAGLSSAATPAEKRDRVAALIEGVSTDVMRDAALIGELLMLPRDERYPALGEIPQQKRELMMTFYLERLEGLAAQRPLVLVFEDIHWFDPTSLDLLDRTITRIAHLPVLVIATFRPEHQPPWVGQPHVTLLHLNRLGRRDSAAIVEEVSRDRPLPQPIVDQIIDRTDGVPLFVKELSRHMLESGPLPTSAIPAKLRAVLSVRLQRLGAVRKLALVGSVIGRRFSRELVAAVLDTELPCLDEALDRLTASRLMSRRGTPPDDSYAFTHALVCDAAYDMVLKDERRRLHSKIATILIDRFSARAEGSPDVIAHHLSQAGRACEAADYWVSAARLAHARWANRESADFFELALREIDKLPRTSASLQTAIDLRFEMKNTLTPLGEFDRIIGCLREAESLISHLDDPNRLCQLNAHMCQTLSLSGKSEEAIVFGRKAERLAGELGEPQLLIEATVLLAMAYFAVTDYRQAKRLFVRVLHLLEETPSDKRFALAGFPGITACAYLTKISSALGEFERGIFYGETAVRQAEELQQPYSLSLSIWCLADLHLSRGNIARAVDLFERGLALSRQWDLPFLVAGHSGSLGYAYAFANRADEGLPLLEQAMVVFEKMKHDLGSSLFLVPLGEAYVMTGRLDQAGDLARRALGQARESGRRSGLAGPLRILADIASQAGLLDEAEAQYRGALVLAEDLGMRPLAARCRHGLAHISVRRSQPEKAHDDLAAATAMYREMGMQFPLGQLAGISQ
jgi:DNA-binding SARP family transcriptional activator